MRHYLLGIITGFLLGLITTATWGMEASQIYNKYAPITVQIESTDGGGSGVIINRTGDVLTCAHLFNSSTTTAVIIPYPGDAFYTAKIIKIDFQKDLALLDISGNSLNWKYVKPRKINVYVGQKVFSISHPVGLTWSISDGIVSGHRRYIKGGFRIQATVVTLPGSSGGPLFDKRGRLIGLMQGIRYTNPLGGFDGLAFAVPIETILDFITIKPRLKIGDLK